MAVLFPEKGRLAGVALCIKRVGVLEKDGVLGIGTGPAIGGHVGDGLDLENGGHGYPVG
jgi:hypothetical protein